MIIALVGVSGIGKSFIKKAVLQRFGEVKPLIAVTTRTQRENETDGTDKYFVSPKAFEDHKAQFDIITDMYHARYAFRRVDLRMPGHCIAEIYYQDVKKIRKQYDIVTILVTTQRWGRVRAVLHKRYGYSMKYYERYLKDRYIRLYLAVHKKSFDYIIVNNYEKNAVDEVIRIIGDLLGEGKK